MEEDLEAAARPPRPHRGQGRLQRAAKRGWWWQRLLRGASALLRGAHPRTASKQRRRQQARSACAALNDHCALRRFVVQYTKVLDECGARRHRFSVSVAAPDGAPLVSTQGAEGDTSGEARNAAAEAALAALGSLMELEEQAEVRARAWLGDAALSAYLGAIGLEAGLSAFEIHRINTELFSNDALSAACSVKLSSSYATATAMEAAVGAAAATRLPALLPLLRAAVGEASPSLLASIEAAVAAKAVRGGAKRKREEGPLEGDARRRLDGAGGGEAEAGKGGAEEADRAPGEADRPPAPAEASQRARVAAEREALAARLAEAEAAVASLRAHAALAPAQDYVVTFA